MSYQFINYSVEDGIATIALNRPERLNAFNIPLADEVIAAMDEVDGDDNVRAAVFTGVGRAFCAGADLGNGTEIFEGVDAPTFDMKRDADYGGIVSRRLFDSLKPLIAAINGPAVGVGITQTLPMDFRLASTTARFGFVFARRGLIPEAASSWFLPRLVGMTQAAEWVYSGRIFDAEEAMRGGLVRSIHEPEDLLPAAYRLAHEITDSSSAVSIAISRRMMWQLYGTGTPELAHEIDSRGIFFLGRSADCAEGVASFLEKREANFPMRVSRDLPRYVQDWRAAGLVSDYIAHDPATA